MSSETDKNRPDQCISSSINENAHQITDKPNSVDNIFTNPAFEGTQTALKTEVEDKITEDDSKKLTDIEAIIHLVKGSLGAGVLTLPSAFQHGGLLFSPIFTIIVTAIVIHCFNSLSKTSLEISETLNRNDLSYPETAEEAFNVGANKNLKRYGLIARRAVEFFLFIEQFGAVTVYIIIIASTFQEVLWSEFNIDINVRWYMCLVFFALFGLSLIRHLKHLVPVSFTANIFLIIALIIIMYFAMHDLPSPLKRKYIGSVNGIAVCISSVYFALQCVGVILPIRNSMKNPTHYHSPTGVICYSLSSISFIYILIGFIGYLKYGEDTSSNIMFNLPHNGLSITIKILFALALIFSTLMLLVAAMDALWCHLKYKFSPSKANVAYTAVKETVVICAVLLAILIPSIIPAVSLVGAFAFFLGITMPVIIETVFYCDIELTKNNWLLYKNIFLFFLSIAAIIFGVVQSVINIMTYKMT